MVLGYLIAIREVLCQCHRALYFLLTYHMHTSKPCNCLRKSMPRTCKWTWAHCDAWDLQRALGSMAMVGKREGA